MHSRKPFRQTACAARRCRNNSGFTLLELIMVMLIVCTVLAMAAPSLRGFFASRRTADAVEQIVALTMYAQSKAVTDGRVYRLNLDLDAGTYWLTAQADGGFQGLGSEFGRTFSFPQETRAGWEDSSDASVNGYIQFYPSGRVDPCTIQVENPQGRIFRISCLSPTERFTVTELEEESD